MNKFSETNKKLIFALSNHHFFNYVIEAYLVILLKNGQFGLDIKKISDNNSQYLNFDIDTKEKEILNILQTTKDENVFKQFSLLKEKKKEKNNTHFSERSLNYEIIPYVSKKTASIIENILSLNVPIYLKNCEGEGINEKPLTFEKIIAEPRFFFSLNKDSFNYKLEIYLNDKNIDLFNSKIISQNPCLLCVENKIIKLPNEFNGNLIKPFLTNRSILVPEAQIKKYLETFVSKIIKLFHVDVSGFSINEENPNPVPIISLAKYDKKEYSLLVDFKYGDVLFPANSTKQFFLKLNSSDNKISFQKTYRNIEKENEFLEKLQNIGFNNLEYNYFSFNMNEEKTLDNIFKYLSLKNEELVSNGFFLNIHNNKAKYFFDKPIIKTEIKEANDWFDLNITIKLNDFIIPFSKIIPNILKDKQEFELPNGDIAIIPEEWFSRYKDFSVFSNYKKGEDIKISKAHLSIVNDFESNIKTKISDKLCKLSKDIPEQDLPKKLNAELRDYQKRGYEWMINIKECGFGGCLADDMGLGKTIQVLSYFLKLTETWSDKDSDIFSSKEEFGKSKDNRKPFTHLIVVPLSLIHNWLGEIRKFAPSLSTVSYVGADRYGLIHYFKNVDVVLTTYGVIRNDFDVLKHISFHTIVLDESQYIKNPESKTYEALTHLSSKQRFVLTGTPLENSITDIWTQMNFLNNGMLSLFNNFKEKYVVPIEKKNDVEAIGRIKKIISPFILRRTKKQVAPELPELTEKICYCTMSKEQKVIYEKKKSEIRNFIIEDSEKINSNKRNIILLSGLMKLRLIANHPKLSNLDYSGSSGKYDEICENIKKVVSEGNKAIIFSTFVKHLNVFKGFLNAENINYTELTGKTTQNDREKNIKIFQENNNFNIFLISLKAGGVGLNLTKADYVFMLDPWWNPASESQAINRTHRIGQNKKVISYKFITVDTIEEKIMLLQRKKIDLFDNIINKTFSKLNEKEIIELFD